MFHFFPVISIGMHEIRNFACRRNIFPQISQWVCVGHMANSLALQKDFPKQTLLQVQVGHMDLENSSTWIKMDFFQAKYSNFNKNPCKRKFSNCFILVTWQIFWISLKGDFCRQNPVISTISHTKILQWFGVGHMESPYSSAWFKSIFFFTKSSHFNFADFWPLNC